MGENRPARPVHLFARRASRGDAARISPQRIARVVPFDAAGSPQVSA
ncbi:hypothetical protein BURPS1106B_A0388 [Burkholderia pseudomallei 1106b]|uniref:Uncharacterized protein n=1 Tax=Burkholderia pseudomallei (strain 1106a) TaxID=357348 RepID=A3NSU3_BURP0|nr:hypothetical protein BURPS1106A_1135 [Burkholderia pseudomallei 1106a]ACQ98681.1 conserved hypothetical protein [Burkholderia pseudomallei MSHR346]EES23870.1 hypothetical protein BURPS1106B_A0388 [Burkholderia pseudomallei 1106b]